MIQVFEEPLCGRPAVPADNSGGNLISKREEKQGRVIGKPGDLRSDVAPNVATRPSIGEKGDVLSPTPPRHDPKMMPSRLVQQRLIRERVGAHQVDPVTLHCGKVCGNTVASRKLNATLVGRERAVSHALDEETVAANTQEFSIDTCDW